MKNIKKFFETPKKTAISILCIAAILAVLGSGSIFAANAIVKNSSIGEEKAQNFAFADAGIDPLSAETVRTEFDFEQGTFVYEVDFVADGTEYEYWVKASDGTIVKKEMKIVSLKGENGNTYSKSKETYTTESESRNRQDTGNNTESNQTDNNQTNKDQTNNNQDNNNQSNNNQDNNNQSNNNQTDSNPIENENRISLDTAKTTALSDAGVSPSEVTYTKEKLDYEDGAAVYDIEFYTSAYEYEYEINAVTGTIRSKDAEIRKAGTGNSDHTQDSGSYIGVDKAKSIAVDHAGFAVSEVYFSKAKLERDDGQNVYEVEFYKDGREYEYTIHAVNGSIMEYDID